MVWKPAPGLEVSAGLDEVELPALLVPLPWAWVPVLLLPFEVPSVGAVMFWVAVGVGLTDWVWPGWTTVKKVEPTISVRLASLTYFWKSKLETSLIWSWVL